MSGKGTRGAEAPAAREAGAEEATDGFVRRALEEFEGPLTGYAQSIVRNLETARDVVQDTFVKLHRQEDPVSLETGGCLKAWLYTVCRNRALDILRKEKRMTVVETQTISQTVAAEAPSPREAAARRDDASRVLALLDQLPPNQREVIRLKFQGDLSYREISEATKLSVGNVGFLLHHGMKRLRDLLEAEVQAEARAMPGGRGEC